MRGLARLERKFEAVRKQVLRQRPPQIIEFITYWGDEVPEGAVTFKTEWGNPLDLSGEDEIDLGDEED